MTDQSPTVRRVCWAAIWQPVFGAYVAIQVRDRMRDGHEYPDAEMMRCFVEEAETVADDAVDAYERVEMARQ